jgi:uncharacterized membrane protein YhaH (DUF805 family)
MTISTTPPSAEKPTPLKIGGAVLPPNSEFSKMVFKILRPGIPVAGWPMGVPSGTAMVVNFEEMTGDYKKYAEYTVYKKSGSLIMASPAAGAAIAVLQAKRLRDICLYSLLPLLFAIPISYGLAPKISTLITIVSVVDAAALIATQLILLKCQKTLANSKFIAHIPTPSLKIKVAFADIQ